VGASRSTSAFRGKQTQNELDSQIPVTHCRHDLLAECRILLLHGLLHLLGWDHELGPEEADSMAAAERQLLAELGWQGSGLISAGNAATDSSTSAAAAADGEVSNSQPHRSCMHRHGCVTCPSNTEKAGMSLPTWCYQGSLCPKTVCSLHSRKTLQVGRTTSRPLLCRHLYLYDTAFTGS